MAVTGEIPDARTVPAKQAVVHPTVAQLPIAVVFAKNDVSLNFKGCQRGLTQQGGGTQRVLAGARCVFFSLWYHNVCS